MLISCRQARNKLDSYAAKALPSGEMFATRAHLNGCHDCRRLLDEARSLSAVVRNASVVIPPQGYLEHLPTRVLANAEAQSTRDATRRGATYGLSVLGAAAMLAFALFVAPRFTSNWTTIPTDASVSMASVALPFTQYPTFDHPSPTVSPRVQRADRKRSDVIEVDLVFADPPEIERANEPVPTDLVAVGGTESPSSEQGRLEQLIALAPTNHRRATPVEEQALAYSTPDAFAWTRVWRIADRRGGDYGLAYARDPVIRVADVTLPFDAQEGRAR